jgi:hypothetical protein
MHLHGVVLTYAQKYVTLLLLPHVIQKYDFYLSLCVDVKLCLSLGAELCKLCGPRILIICIVYRVLNLVSVHV